MNKLSLNRSGSMIIVVVVVLALLIAGIATWRIMSSEDSTSETANSTPSQSSDDTDLDNAEQDDTADEQDEPGEDDSAQTYVVIFDGRNYTPNNLEVAAGDSVRFENQSTSLMWPASDDHPVHSDYPGFDPGGTVAPGDSWTFTFDETGIWGWHDHEDHFITGTITVN